WGRRAGRHGRCAGPGGARDPAVRGTRLRRVTAHTTSNDPASSRTPSAIDAVADAYVQRVAELDPLTATAIGVPGHDHAMTDLSPAGHEARASADRAVLRELDTLERDGRHEFDGIDRVTLAAMRERLGLQLELH